MSAQLTGDWERAGAIINTLATELEKAIKLATHQSALEIEKTLVLHIQNQDLGWAGLSDYYANVKEKKGLSNQIWIATSTLLNSITTVMQSDGTAFVGVLRNSRSKMGTPNVLIGAVLEYGSGARNIQARPLFRPTLKEMGPKVLKRFEIGIENVFKK